MGHGPQGQPISSPSRRNLCPYLIPLREETPLPASFGGAGGVGHGWAGYTLSRWLPHRVCGKRCPLVAGGGLCAGGSQFKSEFLSSRLKLSSTRCRAALDSRSL